MSNLQKIITNGGADTLPERMAEIIGVLVDTIKTIYYSDAGDSPQTTDAAWQALQQAEELARKQI